MLCAVKCVLCRAGARTSSSHDTRSAHGLLKAAQLCEPQQPCRLPRVGLDDLRRFAGGRDDPPARAAPPVGGVHSRSRSLCACQALPTHGRCHLRSIARTRHAHSQQRQASSSVGAEQRTPLKINSPRTRLRSARAIADRANAVQVLQPPRAARRDYSPRFRGRFAAHHPTPLFCGDGLFRSIAWAVGTALLLICKDAGGARATHTRFRKRTPLVPGGRGWPTRLRAVSRVSGWASAP